MFFALVLIRCQGKEVQKNMKTITGMQARAKIISGVDRVLDVIKPTLGPSGKAVLVPRTFSRGIRIIDDGYLAAENVTPKDAYEKMVVEAFREGIKRTNSVAGDGTTGTGVFSGHLIKKLFAEMPDADVPNIGKTKSVRELRNEIFEAKDLVREAIKKQSKKIKTLDDLERIALISIGKEDEETAKAIAKLVWEVARDKDGNYVDNHIEITEGFKGEVETEVIRGMRFPAKIGAPAFVNKPERHEMVMDNIPVILTNIKLENPFDISSIVDKYKLAKVAIFAPFFSTGVLQFMAKCAQAGIHIFPVNVPALRTVQMQDLAIYTASEVIDKDKGMKFSDITFAQIGYAEQIVIKDTENREDAILLGGRGESAVTAQIAILKSQAKEARNDVEKAQLERRIASLGSAVGIVRVGSSTTSDSIYLKMKVEDGVYACKGALEEGYVQGGGLCLKTIAETIPENILTESLKAPYEQLQKNSGNITIGKDIIDPAKVVHCIVEHGATIASTLVTIHSIIPQDQEESPIEGYKDIAKAINRHVYFEAKHKGMLKDSEDEQENDRMKAWEEVMINDND